MFVFVNCNPLIFTTFFTSQVCNKYRLTFTGTVPPLNNSYPLGTTITHSPSISKLYIANYKNSNIELFV